MKLLTFANTNHGGLENLANSLHDSWEFIVLGKGVKWEGWPTRMKIMSEYLKQNVHSEELVVLCDAFDVLCLRPSFDFEKEFQTFQCPLVIGCENTCGANCHVPHNWWKFHGVDVSLEFKYVNGGLMAGKSSAIVALYEWALQHKYTDDQIAIGEYMDQFPDKITLDLHHVLFYNDFNANSQMKLLQDRSLQLTTPTRPITPFFIHFPGVKTLSSIPIRKLFNIKGGENYNMVGTRINGNKHVTEQPCDTEIFCGYLWTERACYLFVVVVLLGWLFYLMSR